MNHNKTEHHLFKKVMSPPIPIVPTPNLCVRVKNPNGKETKTKIRNQNPIIRKKPTYYPNTCNETKEPQKN